MQHTTDRAAHFVVLRQQAEELLQAHHAANTKVATEEIAHLFHELDTYRIELELQNEQLRDSQDQLLRTSQKYLELYDLAPVGYLTLDPRGAIAQVNLTFAEGLGMEKNTIAGRPLSQFIAPEDQDAYYQFLRALRGNAGMRACELRLRGADEVDHWVLLEGTDGPHPAAAEGCPLKLTVSNIDRLKHIQREKQRLAEALEQSRKLEAIGRLAGGMAHDFNNILHIIMGLGSLLNLDLVPGTQGQQDLQAILDAARRGEELCRNLLGFARKGKYLKQPLSLHQLLTKTIALLRRTLPQRIELRAELQAEADTIEGDASQIEQVLLNLALNAADAMEANGLLRFCTAAVCYESVDAFRPAALEPGRYLRLQVIDTGKGMDRQTLEKIFEPLFTTKPTGQGTGLGLAMAYGTVVHHGGHISVQSAPNRGTTVTVLLPLIAPLPAAIQPTKAEPLAHPHRGTVLLVDDEKMIRLSGQRLLEKLGFTVLLAENGQQALALFQAQPEQICLVILDLDMPVMDGAQTFVALRQLAPRLKILISTGYFEETRLASLPLQQAAGFLTKPYAIDALSQRVFEVLDQSEG